MAWSEETQREIDKLVNEQDVSEVIAHAVSQMIFGSIVQYQISVGGPVNCSQDPKDAVDFGERLLCAAIDNIQKGANTQC